MSINVRIQELKAQEAKEKLTRVQLLSLGISFWIVDGQDEEQEKFQTIFAFIIITCLIPTF